MPKQVNSLSFILLASILTLLSLASCQKENSQHGSEDEQNLEASKVSGEAESEAESVFNGLFDDAYGANNEVGLSGAGIFWSRTDSMTPVPRCFTVTITRLTVNPFPVMITVDFGTAGCTGPDGKVRKGKIMTLYTNRLIHPGASATTTFENFFVNDVKVEGTHKITNVSPAIPTIPLLRKFTVDVTDGKLTRPNGNYIEWNSHRILTQIDGLITLDDPRDDVFKIEGTGRGKVRRDALLVLWESTITDPLVRRFTCRWIVRGKIRTIRASLPATSPWISLLDFGNGHCDNLATVTINGGTYNITLR